MAIDVWAQHPTLRFISHPCFDSLKRWTKITEVEQELPIDMTAGLMKQAGVETALLSAWSSPQGDLISNAEVFEWVKKYPDLFKGLACVNLRQPMNAIDDLRRAVSEYGFVGLRVVQWLWEMPCTDSLYYPLLAECVHLDIPICLQVGLTGPLRTSSTGQPAHIEKIALDFPDLKIICGHIGSPWQQEMIAYARKFPNVYIDTSAYLPKRYPSELIEYMQGRGRSKVLFGTNYPMLQPKACLEQVDCLGLDEEAKSMFLTENAKRIFKL